MKKYRLIYKEKTFSYRNGLVKVTDEVLYEEDHPFYKAFKRHFKEEKTEEGESQPQLLVEEPVEDAKVIVEDEETSTEIQGMDGEIISFDESESLDETADYKTLETKEELIKFIEDNGVNVVIGNTKDVKKIKAKIEKALEG